jgi:hypothetical protein
MTAASAPPGLAQTMALIIGGLCAAVAKRIAADRTAGPLILLTVARLRHLLARFTKLAARAQAGKLRPPRRRAPPSAREASPPGEAPPPGEAAPGDPTPNPKPPRQPEQLLPRKFGWLIRFVPYEAACFGSQLQHQLSQPEMTALIEAAPQAGRILRPLCWMLAIPLPPILRLPPRARKPRPPRQPAPERTCDKAPANGRKPRHPPSRGEDGTVYVWRRWRDIWMPEPVRPPKPA